MKFLKSFIIIFLLTFFLTEIIGYILIKTKILNLGLPSWVTFYADEDTSFWHPSNVTFNIQRKNCWSSTVSYNNFGMRDIDDLSYQKKKTRVAILGSSMQEGIQLSDGFDFGSVLKKELENYEVYNFSLRGSGLSDRIDVYKKYISKENFDIILLFINDGDVYYNDFNYHKGKIPNITTYKIINNEVVKIDRDKNFFIKYNSWPNKTKRYISKYLKKLSSYKVYLSIIDNTRNMNIKNEEEINLRSAKNNNSYLPNFEEKKKIYKYIKEDFVKSLNKDTELYVIYNVRSYHLLNKKKINDEEIFILNNVKPFLQKVWQKEGFYDPIEDAKNFLTENNKNEWPFLFIGDCDSHYSSVGVEFYSQYLKKIITKKGYTK
jgi:hypothetical protein